MEPNPVSTLPTHGDVLNDGKTKEAPWILELTPMPVSGTTKGENGINPSEPMTLETVDRFAREIGFGPLRAEYLQAKHAPLPRG